MITSEPICFFSYIIKNQCNVKQFLTVRFHIEPSALVQTRFEYFFKMTFGNVLEQLHRCTVQQIVYEEMSKLAGWTQQNGFGSAFLHRVLRLAKGTAKPNTSCRLARWFDWFRCVAISSLLPFAVPVSLVWVTMGK